MNKKTYLQLQPEERLTIASMKQQGLSVRAIARTLRRAASTISRELERNACPVRGYASAPAQVLSQNRRVAARAPRKLDERGALWPVDDIQGGRAAGYA